MCTGVKHVLNGSMRRRINNGNHNWSLYTGNIVGVWFYLCSVAGLRIIAPFGELCVQNWIDTRKDQQTLLRGKIHARLSFLPKTLSTNIKTMILITNVIHNRVIFGTNGRFLNQGNKHKEVCKLMIRDERTNVM